MSILTWPWALGLLSQRMSGQKAQQAKGNGYFNTGRHPFSKDCFSTSVCQTLTPEGFPLLLAI